MGLKISKTNNALKLMRFIESSMVRHPKNPAINRMMDMEAKTAASRHAVTPLEKLGVDAIFEKKKLGTKGALTPIKDLAGKTGYLGTQHDRTGDIEYSVGHSLKQNKRMNETAKKDLPKWASRTAEDQINAVIEEGMHRAFVQKVYPARGAIAGAEIDHLIIDTIDKQKTDVTNPSQSSKMAIKNIPFEARKVIRDRAMHRVDKSGPTNTYGTPVDIPTLLKQERTDRLHKSITKGYQDTASKILREHGLEDPRDFKDKSKELTKSIGGLNKLQNIRETIMRNSFKNPKVTPRETRWGT